MLSQRRVCLQQVCSKHGPHIKPKADLYIATLLQVGERGWLITSRQDGLYRQFAHEELGCDGTNLFRLRYVNSEPYATAQARTNYAFLNGFVTVGTIPEPDDPSHCRFLWFVFVELASGRCTHSVSCNIIYKGLPSGCTLPVKVLERDRFGDCIKGLAVLVPVMYLPDARSLPLMPPYDKGYTALEY